MAYDVDFWYISQNACQITTTFTPFSEDEGESKQKMLELEKNLGIDVDKELKNIYERSME